MIDRARRRFANPIPHYTGANRSRYWLSPLFANEAQFARAVAAALAVVVAGMVAGLAASGMLPGGSR